MGPAGTSCCCTHLPVNPCALEETTSVLPKTKPRSYLCLSPGYMRSHCVCVWINQLKPHPFPSQQLTPEPHLPPPQTLPGDVLLCIPSSHKYRAVYTTQCTFIHACTQAASEMISPLNELVVRRVGQRTVSCLITRGQCSLNNPTLSCTSFSSLLYLKCKWKTTISKEQKLNNSHSLPHLDIRCIQISSPWFLLKSKHQLEHRLFHLFCQIKQATVWTPWLGQVSTFVALTFIFYWWPVHSSQPRGMQSHNWYVNSKPINFSDLLVGSASRISEVVLHCCPLRIKWWIHKYQPGLTFGPPVIS